MSLNEKSIIGRICSVQKGKYRILFENREITGVLKGKFYQNKNATFPVVGDYVHFVYNEYGDSRIEEICERKSILKRTDQKGHMINYVKTMMEQTMVANFDYVFILTSLNNDYNINRIARYTSLVLEGGGIPVVILTKADLCEDVEKYVNDVKALSNQVRVHAISSITLSGLDELKEYFQDGTTIALLGSSGVGKSTLVNTIVGKEIMKTSAIREIDSKGRHTTTSRELMVLDNGVTLIDTPGMREIGILDDANGLSKTFPEIDALIGTCRFSNCSHTKEPGCAILKALEDGTISEKNWKLYKKLNDENSKHTRMMSVQMKKVYKKQKINSSKEK